MLGLLYKSFSRVLTHSINLTSSTLNWLDDAHHNEVYKNHITVRHGTFSTKTGFRLAALKP